MPFGNEPGGGRPFGGNGGNGIPRPPGNGGAIPGPGGCPPGSAKGGGIPGIPLVMLALPATHHGPCASPGNPGGGGKAPPAPACSIGFACPSAAYEEVIESITDCAFSCPISALQSVSATFHFAGPPIR